jgi:hypothetical protein
MAIYAVLYFAPFVMITFLKINQSKLDEEEFKIKFDRMYPEITVNSRGKNTVMYMPIMHLRRWTTLVVPVLFASNPAL